MEENIKRYEEHGIYKFFRWSGILTIPIITIIPYKALLRAIIKSYYQARYIEAAFGIFMATIGYLYLFYLAIATFIEFYVVAVKVELHEDKIVGYPWYGKKRFEMRYDEIEIIKDRSNIFPGLAIRLLGKDKKMYLSVYIYPLAEVVEEIERRAVNLKESRLKWLKRDKSLWLYGKEDEKKVKNNGE